MKCLKVSGVLLSLFAVMMTSCSSDNDPKPAPPKENHVQIGDKKLDRVGLMLSFKGEKGKTEKDSYILETFLFQNPVVFQSEEKLREDAIPHIRINLQVKVNGIPEEGKYTCDPGSETIPRVFSAWRRTNQVGNSYVPMGDQMSRIYPKYDLSDIENMSLEVKKLDNEEYSFDFKGVDSEGQKVQAYYKGKVNYTIVKK